MSGVQQSLTAALALLGLSLFAWAARPIWQAHRARRRRIAEFRRQIRGLHSGHIDAWRPNKGGNRPPPR